MIAGYFSFGDEIPQFIVLRQPPPGYNDLAMNIGLFGLVIALFIGTTIRVNCTKNNSNNN